MSDDAIDRVTSLVKKWQPLLKLDDWRITVRAAEHPVEKTQRGFTEVLAISSDWRYLKASIFVQVAAVGRYDNPQLEAAVVHELVHALLNELDDPKRADYADHEERVCSVITSIFLALAKKGECH